MSNNRKDFEQPVTRTTVGYRIQHSSGWFVDGKHADRVDENPGYSIKTRGLALNALRQFIWDNHRLVGYTYDIADFYIEGRSFYK